jgi:hypothetical protein
MNPYNKQTDFVNWTKYDFQEWAKRRGIQIDTDAIVADMEAADELEARAIDALCDAYMAPMWAVHWPEAPSLPSFLDHSTETPSLHSLRSLDLIDDETQEAVHEEEREDEAGVWIRIGPVVYRGLSNGLKPKLMNESKACYVSEIACNRGCASSPGQIVQVPISEAIRIAFSRSADLVVFDESLTEIDRYVYGDYVAEGPEGPEGAAGEGR